jgi:hypothetical protein
MSHSAIIYYPGTLRRICSSAILRRYCDLAGLHQGHLQLSSSLFQGLYSVYGAALFDISCANLRF